jgi:hypothetical protein
MKLQVFALFLCFSFSALAQTDTTDEIDFSQLEYAGTQSRTFANPKIFGLSPQRFISVAWDHQFSYDMDLSVRGAYAVKEKPEMPEKYRVQQTSGIRLGLMVPVVSFNRFLWQIAGNYWESNYRTELRSASSADYSGLGKILEERDLKNLNLINTFYLPLDEKQFVIIQQQLDLSGDYRFNSLQPASSLRHSAALLWGKRPHDRKQWAIGLTRTYRAGNMNYLPVFMFNYTSINRKWGSEILFPARAAVRYSFSPRQLLLAGYETEGQTYRISALSQGDRSLEIRRSELRFRLDYQFQLYGFFWVGIQGGMRLNFSYNADELTDDRDFFRGFFGKQTYAMKNRLSPAPFVQLSLNFVSP